MNVEKTYDAEKRVGVLKFQNGRALEVGNVTAEQFDRFAEKHAGEFARRDCVLETSGTVEFR